MLPAIGNTSAKPESKLSDSLSSSAKSQPQPSTPNESSPQQTPPENGERSQPGPALNVRQALLSVLCLMSLQACSLLRPKLPEAAPVPQCPIVQCLDRALITCAGVDPRPVHTCADAVLVASDALGEVVVCQEAHAALIRCVEQFNYDHGR
jgi:hypothetical protein